MIAKLILVQAGHAAPRDPGQTGLGAYREQEFNLALQERLCAGLDADPDFDPIPCPGEIPEGIRVDAALYLHGNGLDSKLTWEDGGIYGASELIALAFRYVSRGEEIPLTERGPYVRAALDDAWSSP